MYLTWFYSLSDNLIGDDGAVALAGILLENLTLEDIVLSRNRIGDIGAAALIESIQQNTTIMHLE